MLKYYLLLLLFNIFVSCLIFLDFSCLLEDCVYYFFVFYSFVGALHCLSGLCIVCRGFVKSFCMLQVVVCFLGRVGLRFAGTSFAFG